MSYPYQSIAPIYDRLMADAPYDRWVRGITRLVPERLPKGGKVLEIGCGSGRVAVELAKLGFEVVGLDRSGEMLALARRRMDEEGIRPFPLFEMDMRHFSLDHRFDLICSFLDSICYLTEEEEWKALFQNVNHHLEPGGLFYFDIHSHGKLKAWAACPIVEEEEGEILYHWLPELIGEGRIIHHLSFFLRGGDGRYDRVDEDHEQRTFSAEEVSRWLEEARFTLLSVTGDFTDRPPTAESERLFFLAQKKSASS